jgi:hypothetical protein
MIRLMRRVARCAIGFVAALACSVVLRYPAVAAPRTPAEIAGDCGLCFVSSVTGTIRLSGIYGDRNPFGPVRRLSITLARPQDAGVFTRLASRHGVIPDGGVYESGHPYWYRVQNAVVTGYRTEGSGPDKGDVHVTLHVTDWTPLPQ